MKKYSFKKLCVDAGNISVTTPDYLKACGVKPDRRKDLHKRIKLPAGRYYVEVVIPNSYEGEVRGHGEIETNGDLLIGDVCYHFSDDHSKWRKVLEDTDFFRRAPQNRILHLDTGGDGSFNVQVIVTPLDLK